MYRRRRISLKKICFVGYRHTGKTKAINYLLGEKYQTVPTLEPYEVKYNNIWIREEVYDKEFNFDEKYKYLFFIRDNKDVFETKKCIDISFVMYKKSVDASKNVIYLNDDPSNIIKHIQ
ncbi:hypothetical protein P3W45_000979 [Vairimorpha bombi]|jgi:GTPase SAR1 family protein